MNLVALGVAGLSAVFFAVSNSLQHHANTGLDRALGRRGTLIALLRQPWWVLGQLLAFTAFSLHAFALHLGLLVLVQPVVVSGIVLAVPLRAALSRRLPSWGELGTVTLTAAGLALFLVAAHPLSSQDSASGIALMATAIGIAVALGSARWASTRRGARQARAYGLGAGVLFGVTAGLVKLAGTDAASGSGLGGHLLALLTSWPAWAVIATGLTGVVLNQRAYRAGPLAASMPLLNIVDVLVAIAFGVVVFGEIPAHNVVAILGEVTALVMMAVGLLQLARQHALEGLEPHDHIEESTASSGGGTLSSSSASTSNLA